MTIARAAEELLREFPDSFAEFSELVRKKRMIGFLSDAMARNALPWILHRGQRRITPDGLEALLESDRPALEAIAAHSRALIETPEHRKPIAERYPLRGEGTSRRRRNAHRPNTDSGADDQRSP